MKRADDFEKRSAHLKDLSDDELRKKFWKLLRQIAQPLVEEARTHTSPSIERSVLLRMGFSSIEAKAIVNAAAEKGLLGHGAGNLVLSASEKNKIGIREAGLGMMEGKYWEI